MSVEKRCTVCGKPLLTGQQRCQHCLADIHNDNGKIKRAFWRLITIIFVALLLEGLWAAGVISPHRWLTTGQSPQARHAHPPKKTPE